MMKIFTAKVVNKTGKRSVVSEQAISRVLFEESLTSRGYYIIDIKESENKKSVFISKTINKKFLLDFTYNLYSLLDFGIDINESFKIMSEIYTHGKEKEFIDEVNTFLKKGEKLSTAIKSSKSGEIFDEFFISMVSSGEHSGNLKESFKLIHDYLKNGQKIKEKLISASIYPMVLLTFSFILLNVFFLVILPNLKSMYDNLKFTPSFFISLMFNFSSFLKNYFYIYFIIIFCIFLGLLFFFKTSLSKKVIWLILNNLPIVKDIIKLQTKIKISFSLEILLKGGSSLEEGLYKLSQMEKNEIIKKEYIKSLTTLKEGGAVRSSFKNLNIYDLKDLNIIEISDSISKAPDGFKKIHEDANNKLEAYLEIIFKLIEPAIIIIVAFFVFFIMYLVISPTLNMLENFNM